MHFLLGILLGVFYFDIGTDAGTLINNIGFVGISVTYMAYTSMLPAVLKCTYKTNLYQKLNRFYSILVPSEVKL